MRMRKALARILVVVLIFSVVAPASQIVVESAGAVSVQVPKYWMDFEDNLNVMTNGAEPVEAQMKVFKMEADYTGEAEFVEDAERGKVLRLGEYGFDLPHLSLDDSYSVSLWVKQEQHMGWASPIFYIRNISNGENYLALSSRNNQREYLLWNQLHPELYPTYELNRWSQYTISVEGKAIALYKDGTLVGTSTRDSIISSDNGMNIAFGVNIWDTIMKACIDDVKIYDKALTAEEARILFSGTPSVQINGSKPEIRVGEKLSLDADAFGVDSADGITLRWSSTNNAVAKIVNGVVTGISEGSASISAALMKGENEIARDTFDINVVTSAGNYITPKYEMSLEGDLAVTGGLEPKLVTFGGSLPSYEGDAEYIDGIDGQAINLAGKYGFILENVAVDSTYTVSFYGKSNSRMQNHRPVCFISSDRGCSNWVALAGKDEGDGNGKYKLWGNGDRGNPEYGDVAAKGEWTQYTITADGPDLCLYENGILKVRTREKKVNTANGLAVMFGVNIWDAAPDCAIDEIKIYDEAFSAQQAKALYEKDIAVRIVNTRPTVKLGETIPMDAEVLNLKNVDQIAIEWNSDAERIATVENGVVKGISEGIATITASVKENGVVQASDSFRIGVIKPRLIANFTFDDAETGLSGADAVAVMENQNETVAFAEDGDRKVLKFTGSYKCANYNFLNVTRKDGSSLLSGLKEFTISYDSFSEGKFQNNWTFFADNPGMDPNNRNYIALADASDNFGVERHGESLNTGNVYSGWKHIDVVFYENKTEVFVNGRRSVEMENEYSVEEIFGEDAVLWIGKASWPEEYWAGMLDNYKIYNYALTEKEIAETPINTIKVSSLDGTTEVELGKTLALEYRVTPENAYYQNVVWSSSDEAIATVDENGVVTPLKEGQVTITVSAQDREALKTAKMEIIVHPVGFDKVPVESIQIRGGPAEGLTVGSVASLEATVLPEDASNKNITWSSSDEKIAIVGENGTVAAQAVGKATITAAATDGSGVIATAEIKVLPVKVSKITIEGAPLEGMEVNDTLNLSVAVEPRNAEDKSVSWSSSAEKIATVNENGVVTAHAVGSATITAAARDGSGVTGTAEIEVIPTKVSAIMITGAESSDLTVGGTIRLSASVAPEHATDKNITWSSDNTAVASVTSDGMVTAHAAGKAVITATAADESGVKKGLSITVVQDGMPKNPVSRENNGIIYFVDCGDEDVTTLSEGDQLGTHNSITDQVYGHDTVTGYRWGIVDTQSVPLLNGSYEKGVCTDHTWPYEYNKADGVPKTASNRYARNQSETGIDPRYIDYRFELEKGKYMVEVGMSNPWGAACEPKIYLNYGTDKQIVISDNLLLAKGQNQSVSKEIELTEDSVIGLNVRGSGNKTNTLNLAYILIKANDSVQKIEITGAPEGEVEVGYTTQLSANILPDYAANKEVVWSSDNDTVVSVDADGTVTAHAQGEAVITATAADGSGTSASVTIHVKEAVIPVTGIEITNAPQTMTEEDTYTLTAVIMPEDATNQEVTWISSDANILAVENGVLTAKSAGTATITAVASGGENIKAEVAITVQPKKIPVTGIDITGVSASLTIGDTAILSAVVMPENATSKEVTWASSNPGIVSVTDGKISAIAPGQAVITAMAQDGSGVSGSIQITVKDFELSGLTINSENEQTTIQIGETLQFHAAVAPEQLQEKAAITWSSEQEAIAYIDANGLLTARKAGTAKIKATAEYNGTSVVSNELTITVEAIPVTSITISGEAEREMMLGDIAALSVSVLPTNATDPTVVWTSTDERVVFVNQNNTIMAKAEGTAVITATAKDGSGVSASVKVTVKEKTYQVTVTNGTIENGKAQYKYGERATVSAELTTEAGNFVGWQNANRKFVCYSPRYSFAVLSDVAITAVYAKEEPKKEVVLNCSVNFDAAKDRMVFTGERVVPAAVCKGGKVKAHGIILTATPDIGENEGAFQIGNEKITNSVAKETYGLLGTYTVTVKGTTGRTYYARSYVTYIDAETKEEVTMYSNIVKIERP